MCKHTVFFVVYHKSLHLEFMNMDQSGKVFFVCALKIHSKNDKDVLLALDAVQVEC